MSSPGLKHALWFILDSINHPGDIWVPKERILFITGLCDIPENESNRYIYNNICETILPKSSFIIFLSTFYTHISFALVL